jgi:hypothetical protein
MLLFSSTSDPTRDGTSHTMRDFVQQMDREIQRGTPINALVMMFLGFQMLNRGLTKGQCRPLLNWISSASTLRELMFIEARQGPMTKKMFQWIIRALLSRASTLPAIPSILCVGVDLTAEDMARLLHVCQPERLTWTQIGIVHTTLCPTNHEALEHIGTALRGTTSTLKRLQMDADLCLSRNLLQGLQNHNDYFELAACSRGGSNPVPMTQEHANTLVELLRHSTGEWKKLGLSGYRWRSDPVFALLTSAFRDSSSYYEIGFEMCTFDAASARLLCAAFSSPQPKAIKIGKYVVFPSDVNVLETLAGSSPTFGHIDLKDECELSHLKAILRGLAMSTSTLQTLYLPTLPVNQVNLLLNAIPKFTHLNELEFATETVPLSMKRRLLMAFKRNGCLVNSMMTCPIMDQAASDKLTAYHSRNKYLPEAFDSAIENKVPDHEYGPGEFSFLYVPSLLRATIDATAAAQGPTRVLDVLKRCKGRIGPFDF